MQLGALARWLKRDPVSAWEGELLTVSTEGHGRDVVLVHGLAASPECWDGAAAMMGGGDWRMHLVHMRGFAGLPASGLRDPMNFLKPAADGIATYIRSQVQRPIAVAGHSMGGIVSLILARDHPDIIDRLMVIDVPAYFSVLITPFATPASMAGLAQHSRRSYMEKSRTQLEDDLRRTSDKLVRDPAYIDRVVRWGLASDRRTTADVMAEVMVTDLRGDLQRIAAPVDVVYAWDRSAQPSKLALDQVYGSAYAGLQRGRRLRIDDARHYVMFDQPEAFYAAMREWLER